MDYESGGENNGGKSLRMQYWNVCKACKVFSCLNEYVALAWHKDFFMGKCWVLFKKKLHLCFF